jgi:cobalt-zinc-cadmium resistance protein CzcA
MASVIGVCTLGGVVMLSGMRRTEAKTDSVEKGIERGALAEMRPVVMACAAAGLGLLRARYRPESAFRRSNHWRESLWEE